MKGSVLFGLIVLLLVYNERAESLAPGFKTVVSQNGLNYFTQVGTQILQQVLLTLQIPDISGDDDTPIGKVDWWLEGLKITELALPQNAITITPGVGLSLSIAQVSVGLTLSWRYRKVHWPHVSDHGTADISVSQTTAVVNLQITAANGRPVVAVASDGVAIGKLDIKLHGGASWLYNFFINILSGKLKSAVEKALTDGITKNIDNGLNKVLATLPIEVPVNHEVEIDYEFVANPVFSPGFVSVPALGEFYSIANPTECPAQYCPTDSLPEAATAEMVQMELGDYVANSAGYVFWQRGDLKLWIADKDIPSWAPIRLNTTSWKYILPQLTKLYPNNLMEVHVYASTAPVGVFSPSGAAVTAYGDMDFLVILPNGTMVPAFTLQGFVATSAEASINGETVFGVLSYIKGNWTLYQSQIGWFDATILADLLDVLFQKGIVPFINVILSQGIVLPTVQGLTFVQPTIGWGSGYLYISTNVQYSPSLDDGLSAINIAN